MISRFDLKRGPGGGKLGEDLRGTAATAWKLGTARLSVSGDGLGEHK